MADEPTAAQGLAGLAVCASLLEALLKRGVIEQADVDAIIEDASSYVAALSIELGQEVEGGARRLLTLIGRNQAKVAVTEGPHNPIVDPTN